MALVESLLTAIARADGDALVMHVGEKPYVVGSAGPIELSNQGLNLQAMAGMVAQLLPDDAQRSLAEFGAVEHELTAYPPLQDDRFTVVVARGGDDVWIEVRRHRGAAASAAPPVAPDVANPSPTSVPDAADGHEYGQVSHATAPTQVDTATEPAPLADAIASAEIPIEEPVEVVTADVSSAAVAESAEAASLSDTGPAPSMTVEPETLPTSVVEVVPDAAAPEPVVVPPVPVSAEEAVAAAQPAYAASYDGTYGSAYPNFAETTSGSAHDPHVASLGEASAVESLSTSREDLHAHVEQPLSAREPHRATFAETTFVPTRDEHRASHETSTPPREDRTSYPEPTVAATVIPMTRTLRIEVPPMPSLRHSSRTSQIHRWLETASSRGATALYLTTQSAPHIRIDADVRVLESEPPLSASDVESAIHDVMPESARASRPGADAAEWATDLPGIGEVRCSTFRDHRGPGAIFQLVSMRPIGAEQLGLSAEIRALATEAEGLVLIATAPGNGKTTLVGALVDSINRQRSNYVITIERQIRLVHDHHNALVSQREVHGDADQVLAATVAALRENPDVLVIEALNSFELLRVALEAAGSGVLVIAAVTAPSTTAALAQLVALVPENERATMQTLLADRLRGAVAQLLLRKSGGGRVAAREVILPTTPVISLVAEGRLQDLPAAVESGRKYGLITLTDALVQLVQSGAVDLREAYRKGPDRDALLAALQRQNFDTAIIERFA
jgi:twitching motility protein PilT